VYSFKVSVLIKDPNTLAMTRISTLYIFSSTSEEAMIKPKTQVGLVHHYVCRCIPLASAEPENKHV